MIRRREPEAGAAESEELERLCDQLGRVEAPFDEIARSRAEARLGAELAREPARRQRRALGWAAALVAVGAAAAFALAARTVVPGARSRVAGGPEPSLRFEPYVVAPTPLRRRRARLRRRPCRRRWCNRPRASTSRRGGWCARHWATPSRSR